MLFGYASRMAFNCQCRQPSDFDEGLALEF